MWLSLCASPAGGFADALSGLAPWDGIISLMLGGGSCLWAAGCVAGSSGVVQGHCALDHAAFS